MYPVYFQLLFWFTIWWRWLRYSHKFHVVYCPIIFSSTEYVEDDIFYFFGFHVGIWPRADLEKFCSLSCVSMFSWSYSTIRNHGENVLSIPFIILFEKIYPLVYLISKSCTRLECIIDVFFYVYLCHIIVSWVDKKPSPWPWKYPCCYRWFIFWGMSEPAHSEFRTLAPKHTPLSVISVLKL